jgi:hypothetical protein
MPPHPIELFDDCLISGAWTQAVAPKSKAARQIGIAAFI